MSRMFLMVIVTGAGIVTSRTAIDAHEGKRDRSHGNMTMQRIFLYIVLQCQATTGTSGMRRYMFLRRTKETEAANR